MAYDATNILLQAIDKAASDQVEGVRLSLEKIDFYGVTGRLKFDNRHNPIKTAVVLGVRNGKVVLEASLDP